MSILALTSNTLVTAASGQIEYNGQFFGTDSNASRAQMQRITQGTAVASTSGTSINFTSLPAWVKRITVMFQGVSTSSTSNLLVQIGSGSISNTGYESSGFSTNTTNAGSTAGFILTGVVTAASSYSGSAVLTLLNSSTNMWVNSSILGQGTTPSSNGGLSFGGGYKAASGTLDQIRITTVNGTDTFDAGTINLLWE
jgi:hypothetical protein